MVEKEKLDKVDLKVLGDIKTYGWSCIQVFPTKEGDGPPFSYTVGLDRKDHPELLIVGLNGHQAHQVLNAAFIKVTEGTPLVSNTYASEVLTEFPVGVIEVIDVLSDEFPMSMATRLQGQIQGLQLVWPDANGRFPWHGDYDSTHIQPLTGIWGGVDE